METDTTPDIRLVYLAFHHMLKHRGHFLFSGSIDEIRNFNNVFKQLSDALRSEDLPFNKKFFFPKLSLFFKNRFTGFRHTFSCKIHLFFLLFASWLESWIYETVKNIHHQIDKYIQHGYK